MGRQKYIQCSVCSKNIRSDKIKFHKHERGDLQYKKKTCPTCKTSMKAGNLSRHMRKHAKQLHLDLIEELRTDQMKSKENLEKGLFIKDYIQRTNIDPKMLRKEYQKVIKTKVGESKVDLILKPWQEKLLELMKPSEREILWIVGPEGNEGKTWFQKHLKDIYGSRVFKTHIKKSPEGILHVLSKEFVPLIELFLFNVPRSFDMDAFPYDLLEELKDGEAESTKYDSSKLELNTPNTVMVFSNEKPNKEQMSKDRWTIYLIGGEYLFHTDGYKVL